MFKSLTTKLLTIFLILTIALLISFGIYLIGYYKYQPFDKSNTITVETTICNVQLDKRTSAGQHVETNYFIEFGENNQYVIDDESLYEQIKELETKQIEAEIIISYSYPATNEGYHVLSLKTADTEYISFEESSNSYVRGGRGIYLTIASFPFLFTVLGVVWIAYYCPVFETKKSSQNNREEIKEKRKQKRNQIKEYRKQRKKIYKTKAITIFVILQIVFITAISYFFSLAINIPSPKNSIEYSGKIINVTEHGNHAVGKDLILTLENGIECQILKNQFKNLKEFESAYKTQKEFLIKYDNPNSNNQSIIWEIKDDQYTYRSYDASFRDSIALLVIVIILFIGILALELTLTIDKLRIKIDNHKIQ